MHHSDHTENWNLQKREKNSKLNIVQPPMDTLLWKTWRKCSNSKQLDHLWEPLVPRTAIACCACHHTSLLYQSLWVKTNHFELSKTWMKFSWKATFNKFSPFQLSLVECQQWTSWWLLLASLSSICYASPDVLTKLFVGIPDFLDLGLEQNGWIYWQ